MRGGGDDDATIKIAPPTLTRRRLFPIAAAGGTAVAICCGVCGWIFWPRRPVAPPPAPIPPPKQAAISAPAFKIQTADEATILGHVAEHLTFFRFAANPNVIVADFPSLHMQGEMLNRVASLIEKAGLPRHRVLTETQLDAAIRASGDTADTYYYGHDYRAGALAYFLTTAGHQELPLNAEEQRLRDLVRQLGWNATSAVGALISIARADQSLTQSMRATMLHHELSHGEFFTDTDYAAYVRSFWLDAMSEEERGAMRHFLGSMDYDTGNEELMYNEMQAYMMFTYDPRFFLPSNVNMSPKRRAQLQSDFLGGMSDGWLKAALSLHIEQVRQAQQ
jgi:hypothetical protein